MNSQLITWMLIDYYSRIKTPTFLIRIKLFNWIRHLHWHYIIMQILIITGQESYESAQKFILQAMRHRQGLSENHEIPIRILYYLILGENDKAIALAEMQHELQPNNIQLLLRLIDTYDRNFMIQKLEGSLEQLNELLPDMPLTRFSLPAVIFSLENWIKVWKY